MVGFMVFISLSLLAVCQANVAVAPPVQCGRIPSGVYKCMENPKLVTPEVEAQCPHNPNDDCEDFKCSYRASGWMDGDKIDKPKMIARFDQYAKDNPQWQVAVDHLKTNCLQADLPPQGIYLDCPAFDIAQCIFESFIRNAQPDQWSSGEECEIARRFIAQCPFCPPGCDAPEKPVGSCNACNALPRST